MNRKMYYWKLRTTELQLGERTLIMGVLNVTPDSFSDGGRFLDPDRAYARALEMEEQGADIIDIGAESTRPESRRISSDEEWQRLVPVLRKLRDKLGIPLSLDTYKAEIAERALEYGIEIINDPSGLTLDADLGKVAVKGDTGLILNHMRGAPETWGSLPPLPDVMGSITRDLDATTSRARRAGVEKNRIVVDPGLGFGKRKEQNSDILAHLGKLSALDYPILAAPSRKAFLATLAEGQTVFATAAAVTAAILNGAHIVRVHDIKEMRAAAAVADEIARMAAQAVRAAEEEQAEQPVKRARPTGLKALPAYMGEEKAPPMRPPLLKVEKKVEPAPAVEAVLEKAAPEPGESVAATAETAEPMVQQPAAEKPREAAKEQAPKLRPPQTAPSKGWTPTPSPQDGASPQRFAARDSGDRPSRPAFGGPPRRDGDRPSRPAFGGPPRRDGDRPSRPAFGGPPRRDGDRPSRPAFGGPPRRDGDRPSRPAFGGPPRRDGDRDRPIRPAFSDRPPRQDAGDRPTRPPYGGPPRGDSGDRPQRPSFSDRPPRGDAPSDRPFKGPSRGGPSQGRPPQGGPPKRPFRKRP